MTVLNLQVGASGNDSHQQSIPNDAGRNVTGTGVCSLTDTILQAGSHSGGNEWSVAAAFVLNVAQGETINSAVFSMRAAAPYASPGTVKLYVSVQNSDAPAALSSSSADLNASARPRSTAAAVLDVSTVTGGTWYSWDITAPVQELVNRAAWAANNRCVVLVDTHEDTTINEWQDFDAYDGAPAGAPKLDVDFGGSGPASISLTGLSSGEAFGAPVIGDITPGTHAGIWEYPYRHARWSMRLLRNARQGSDVEIARYFGVQPTGVDLSLTGLASSEALGSLELSVALSLTGLASSEAFGVPTIGSAAASVSLTGLASSEAIGTPSLTAVASLTALAGAEAFGSPSLPVALALTGLASAGALGTPSFATVVSPAALAGAEALGAPTLSASASLVGIASGEAVGAPALAATLALTGLSTSEAFGAPTVGGVPASVTLTGLATSEALGSPALAVVVSPAALASAGALGSPALTASVGLTGIASGEAFGSPNIGGAPASVTLAGLATSEAVGAPALSAVIAPTGVASALAFGAPSVAVSIGLAGLATGEAFGTPTIGGAPASISLTGLASGGVLGSIAAGVVVAVIGLASSEAVGVPSLSSQVSLEGLISAEAFGWPTLTGPLTRFVPLTLDDRDGALAVAERDKTLALEARGVLLTVSKTHDRDLELSARGSGLNVRNR